MSYPCPRCGTRLVEDPDDEATDCELEGDQVRHTVKRCAEVERAALRGMRRDVELTVRARRGRTSAVASAVKQRFQSKSGAVEGMHGIAAVWLCAFKRFVQGELVQGLSCQAAREPWSTPAPSPRVKKKEPQR